VRSWPDFLFSSICSWITISAILKAGVCPFLAKITRNSSSITTWWRESRQSSWVSPRETSEEMCGKISDNRHPEPLCSWNFSPTCTSDSHYYLESNQFSCIPKEIGGSLANRSYQGILYISECSSLTYTQKTQRIRTITLTRDPVAQIESQIHIHLQNYMSEQQH
jgi:hypothetical protein